jgi:hypothetical protein
MPATRIGGETVVLYADLRERLATFDAMRSIASIPGEFTTKVIKGNTYHYYQATLSAGRLQIYLGRDSDEIRQLISDRNATRGQARSDETLFERLGAQWHFSGRRRAGGQHRFSCHPVYIRRLNAAAQPLKYLDFVLEDPLDAVVISGKPCLAKVPQPARFALHKLIVSQERSVVSADKQRKDIAQARLVLDLLREDRPGDIREALAAIEKRGSSWVKKLQSVCTREKIEL